MIVTPLAVSWLVKHLGISGVGWANLISWIFGAVGISWITFRYLPSQQTAKDALEKLTQSETLQP
jgi:Na+-driven multidrug efflux pump